MVLMSVSEHDSPELALVAPYICEIRNDAVYARHVLVGEAHSDIDYYDVISIFKSSHVLADLAETAKRYYLQIFTGYIVLMPDSLSLFGFFRFFLASLALLWLLRLLSFLGIYLKTACLVCFLF